MKFAAARVALTALLLPRVSVVAWEEDFENCPEHRPRRLVSLTEDQVEPTIRLQRENPNQLRGSSRKLAEYSIKLRMYWELGYCWQNEYNIEHDWCIECEFNDSEYGSECLEGDKLVIDLCGTSPRQRFIYEGVSGTGGGKIKPEGSPNLCLTKDHIFAPENHERDISWMKFRLKPCADDDNDKQVFLGFDPDDRFELKPYSDESYCLTQDHDPMRNEEILGMACSIARGDHTSFFHVIDAEGLYDGPNPSRPEPAPTAAPPSCDPYFTGLNGQSFISSNDDPLEEDAVTLEQRGDGNLVVYYNDEVVWSSLGSDTLPESIYVTSLQGDANLVTRDKDGAVVWKSNSVSPTDNIYFFGLDCDKETVGIYPGIPTNPRAPVWTSKN